MRLKKSSSALRSAPFFCNSFVSLFMPDWPCDGFISGSRFGSLPIGLIEAAGFILDSVDSVGLDAPVRVSLKVLTVSLTINRNKKIIMHFSTSFYLCPRQSPPYFQLSGSLTRSARSNSNLQRLRLV